MFASNSTTQLRLGTVLLVSGFLPLSMPATAAEPSQITVTSAPLEETTAPAAGFRQQSVHYGDLALDTAEGLTLMHQRLVPAVRNVCMHADPREFGSMRDVHQCREQAQARATADVQAVRGANGSGTTP